MKKNYIRTLKHKLKLLSAVMLFASFSLIQAAFAQTATIGSGTTATTSTGSDPINAYYESMHYQVVYTATELTTAGMGPGSVITALGWSVSGDYGGGNLGNYTIKMAHTSATNAASHNSAALTQVVNPFNYNPTVVSAGSFDMITFNNSFIWDGASNLLIDVCTSVNAYISPYGAVRTIASSTANGSRYYECDGCGDQCGTATGSTNTTKPQIRFNYITPPACASMPVPGALSVSTPASCAGNFTVSQVFPGVSGITYQWKESSAIGGPFIDVTTAGNSLNYSAPANSVTMYYQVVVTCTATSQSATSAVIAVDPPALNGGTAAISSVPGCSSAGFTLNTSGATSGTLTYQWQDSLPGGTWANTSVATASSTNTTLVATANVGTPTYFRRQTICAASLVTANSAPVLVEAVAGGTAAATNAVCGDSLTLSLVSNTSGSGVTYQWEESTDTIGWIAITGATSASQKTISPLAVNYYRCIVTCGSASSTSRFVKVLPVKGGTTSLSSSFCNDSTTLTLSGASTGTALTYNWLQSSDSISWVPMSITSATAKFPSPSSSYFYRSVVSCGASSDTSVARKVVEPCLGFKYDATRSTGITYSSILTDPNAQSFAWGSPTSSPATNSAWITDENTSDTVQMPFPFMYGGELVTTFRATVNGFMYVNKPSITTHSSFTNSSTEVRAIAPMWDDLLLSGNPNTVAALTAATSPIRYLVSGTAGSRILTVEWSGLEQFSNPGPDLNFQVKLYEGSNNIEFRYGNMIGFNGTSTTGFGYTLGIIGANASAGQRVVQTIENTDKFTSTAGSDNLANVPFCNTAYLFTPNTALHASAATGLPSNDDNTTPVLLTTNAAPCADYCGTYYSSRGATATAGVNICSTGGNPDDDVWFEFEAPSSGQVQVNVTGSYLYDPAFQIMSLTLDTTGMGTAGCRNASSSTIESVTISSLTPSVHYLIRVFHAGTGANTYGGAFSICVNEVVPPPMNDDTSGSILLTAGKICSPTAGSTLGGTASVQAVCAGLADDDVWYRFVPSASSDTVVVDGSASFRAHVQVLTRTLTSVSCQNATTNGGLVSTVLTGLLKDSTYYIRVYHTNAGAGSANFTICVQGDSGTAPVVKTGAHNSVFDIGANISGEIISSGGFPVTASGFVFGTSLNPVLGDPGVVDSTTLPVITSGTFSKDISGLSPLTIYHYRTYATNALGTSYGIDSTFTTTAGPTAPSVNIATAANIQTTSASLGGSIFSNGGSPVTVSGIVYGTTHNPSIGDLGVKDTATNPAVVSGSFSLAISGLTHSTKYYYRAFATNGIGTGYSIEDSFTTALIVTSLPYTENFDAATTPWTTAGINGGTNAWVKGSPTKTFLNGTYSGPNAFVTYLTGNYTGTEECVLQSPQFDFTGVATDPVIRFKHRMDTDIDPDYDGGAVEISINNGTWTKLDANLGTGANNNTPTSYAWYNSAGDPLGVFGVNFYGNITSGYASSTPAGWIEGATRLTGAANQVNVRVRFRFYGDDFFGGDVDEGWEIDDIEVVSIATPSTPASAVVVPSLTGTTANVAWTNGNGQGRLVVARLTSTTAVTPTDNKLYAANTAFATQDSTGLGNYVVYSNTGSSVVATGLSNFTDYTYDVYEYNGKYMHVNFTPAASNNATTLPVKLNSFNAVSKANNVLLNWSTASETNNRGFNIERSIDGRNFDFVDFVKGAGNSSRTLNYTLTDTKAFDKAGSNTLYYRLKQMDFDGKSEYSQIVKVSQNAVEANALSVFPNPYSANFNISFIATYEGKAAIEITDLQGKTVASQNTTVVSGSNIIPITESANLTSGIYFVHLMINGETQVLKLIKN